MSTVRIGEAQWVADLTSVNAASTAPTAATNGVSTVGRQGEYAHFSLCKTNTVNIDFYGYDGSRWVVIDTYAFTGTGHEALQLVGVSAYQRVHGTITGLGAQGVGAVNTAWGFTGTGLV